MRKARGDQAGDTCATGSAPAVPATAARTVANDCNPVCPSTKIHKYTNISNRIADIHKPRGRIQGKETMQIRPELVRLSYRYVII